MGRPRFLSIRIIFVVVIFELVAVALAFGNSKNRFVNPPAADSADNPLWYLGEQQTISWITELEEYEIAIWQQYPTESVANYSGVVFCKYKTTSTIFAFLYHQELTDVTITIATHEGSAKNFTWTVQTYGRDLDFSHIFFFWAGRGDENNFTSNYFNISSEKPPAQTTSVQTSAQTTPTPTPTQTTPPIIPTPEPSSPQPDDNDPEPEKSGLSTSTKIGLGVGLSVGVLVLAIAGFVAYRFIRWQKPKRTEGPEGPRIRGGDTISELPNKPPSSRFLEPAELDGGQFNRN